MKLAVNPEYEKLLPKVSTLEYSILKESIKQNGLWVPILVNSEGVILDGHHREHACKALGIPIKYAVREFENKLLEKKFVIECNLIRRHLNDFQKSELGISLLKIEIELAKQRVNQHSFPSNEGKHKGEATELTAKQIGVSRGTFERAKKIIDEAPEETKQKLREGNPHTSITKEYQKLKKVEKRNLRQEEIKKLQVNLPESVTLFNQEFQSVSIPDDSISLIFTDPPYAEEYIHLYEDLAIHASRVLREGGSLICYVGHYAIGKIINMMESQGLEYHWIISVDHSGPSASVFGKGVLVGWKPMLWFTKGKYTPVEFVKDKIKSEFQGKELHKWAQSTVESDYFIKHLTIENEIIYDPFVGQGTFGVSAVKLKRQFIGAEVDAGHFANAERMISNANHI